MRISKGKGGKMPAPFLFWEKTIGARLAQSHFLFITLMKFLCILVELRGIFKKWDDLILHRL